MIGGYSHNARSTRLILETVGIGVALGAVLHHAPAAVILERIAGVRSSASAMASRLFRA